MADIPFRLQPDSPLEDNLARINDAFDEIAGEDRTKIVRNTGVPQILFGFQKSGFGSLDYGLKVSKIDPATGKPFDVTRATDDQLAFNSAFDHLRVRFSDNQSIVIPGSGAGGYGTHATIPHGLSFVPAVLSYVKVARDDELIGDFWYPTPYGSLSDIQEFAVAADATNIYLTVYVADIADWYNYSVDFRYYVLQQTAD